MTPATRYTATAIAPHWLAALHVAAALKHQFIDRDATLRRILPFSKGV